MTLSQILESVQVNGKRYLPGITARGVIGNHIALVRTYVQDAKLFLETSFHDPKTLKAYESHTVRITGHDLVDGFEETIRTLLESSLDADCDYSMEARTPVTADAIFVDSFATDNALNSLQFYV